MVVCVLMYLSGLEQAVLHEAASGSLLLFQVEMLTSVNRPYVMLLF